LLMDHNKWLDANRRKKQFLDTEKASRPFYFGYRQVSADEKAERVRRHFDSVAHCYDFMNTFLSLGIHYLWKKTAVRMMALKRGQRVLDVCGGTGDLSVLASRVVGVSGQVVLYDMNWNMITAGKPRIAGLRSGRRIAFVQGDAEHLAFPDRHFDAVMVGFGIRNVIRMENGVSEMHRVLKPGGKMMCLEFSKPTNPVFRQLYDLYSQRVMPAAGRLLVGIGQAYAHLPESIRMFAMPEEMSLVLEKAGFTGVRYRRLTNGIATVHLAQKGNSRP